MTTITIESNLNLAKTHFETLQDAADYFLETMGYTLLEPVVDEALFQKIKTHQKNNSNRSIETYDDI